MSLSNLSKPTLQDNQRIWLNRGSSGNLIAAKLGTLRLSHTVTLPQQKGDLQMRKKTPRVEVMTPQLCH